MNDDLKIIKKKYGEEFAHLCRELFPTILEKKGILSDYLLNHFTPSRNLVKDIKSSYNVENFRDYVMSQISKDSYTLNSDNSTPEQLLKKAGYKLYECITEDDIQSFRKYYKKGEELCTFTQKNRLKHCHVFFAVKENVDEIKRENFTNPARQDEYGVSVISIQFTRDSSHILSIKNRYNHHVEMPDATFSNNLDNIIIGLTQSFKKYYNLEEKIIQKELVIPGYVKINDKYIKLSYRMIENNNIYLICENNTVIKNGIKTYYDKDKYLIIDYFLLNLKDKKIETIDNIGIKDSFFTNINNIEKINIKNINENKEILLTTKNNIIKIIINNQNKIIYYENSNQEILSEFLTYNNVLEELKLDNLKEIKPYALTKKYNLNSFILPNGIKEIPDHAFENTKIQNLVLPDSVTHIGKNAFSFSRIINIKLSENLEKIEDFAFTFCSIRKLRLPKSLKYIGKNAFANNNITQLNIENTNLEIDENAFSSNDLNVVILPENVKIKPNSFSTLTKIIRKNEVNKCK